MIYTGDVIVVHKLYEWMDNVHWTIGHWTLDIGQWTLQLAGGFLEEAGMEQGFDFHQL